MQWNLIGLFLWLGSAIAQESNEDTGSETSSIESTEEVEEVEEVDGADEEIIVYGKREVDRRRRLLDAELEASGYRQGKRKGDKVVYRPETVWHPSVVVYDSGWVDLKKTPPRFEPWIGGRPDNKWRYLSCIPPFGLMCIKASGWLITKRRAQHSKTAVVDNHIETIQYWQESVIGRATQQRLEIHLPDELDLLWNNDSLSSVEKTEQIIHLWHSRTCTPEGLAAANVIADFLTYEVHPESPINTITLQWMADNNPCRHTLPEID